MNVSLDRHALDAAIHYATKFTEPKTPIRILSTVLLRACNGTVEVMGANLDILFKATVEARVETEGAIAVNAALFGGFVHGSEGTDVELALDGSVLQVKSGRARSRLPTLPAEDFPQLFNSRAGEICFEIDGTTLADCRDAVSYAILKEDSRYYLQGTSWQLQDGRLELCATNGHALSLISIEAPAGAEGLKPSIVPDFKIPPFDGPVRVELTGEFIRLAGVVGSPMQVTSKLIDGTFPDYRRFVRPAIAAATVSRKALADAVERCMPLVKMSRAAIDLVHDTPGELLVRVLASDGAEIEDRLEISGEQFTVSMGGALLEATLDSFDTDTLKIGFSGIGDVIRFGEPDNTHRLAIVMPMRGAFPQRIGPPLAETPA